MTKLKQLTINIITRITTEAIEFYKIFWDLKLLYKCLLQII
jgi:hypothetical protein